MIIIDPGHRYKIENINPESTLKCESAQELIFVKRFREKLNHPGTINQELIRVLIDRVMFLNKEVQWEGNDEIIYHLRMALVLHESRALFRKVHKGELFPENILTGIDGHFLLTR